MWSDGGGGRNGRRPRETQHEVVQHQRQAGKNKDKAENVHIRF